MSKYCTYSQTKYQRARRERVAHSMCNDTLLADVASSDCTDSIDPMNIDSFDDYLDSNEHFLGSNAKMSGKAHFDLSDADSKGSIDTDTSSESDDDSDMSDGGIADSRPVFHQASRSVQEASLDILNLARKLNLNKSNIKLLLDCFHKLIPKDNKLPRTTLGLLRRARVESSQKVSYFCSQCLSKISSNVAQKCSFNCSLDTLDRLPINVVEVHWNDVSRQVKRIAERYLPLIEDYSSRYNLIPADIPNSSIFQQLPRPVSASRHLTLLL